MRLENEDSKRRQNTAKSNIAKLEKENARLKNDRDEAKKELEDLTRKLRKLEQGNAELLQEIEKKERQYQQIEDSLQASIDQTRNQIEEEIKAKNLHEQRFKDDSGLHHNKLGCVVRMVVDSILPHAESGPNDYREDAPRLFFLIFDN